MKREAAEILKDALGLPTEARAALNHPGFVGEPLV